MADQPAPDTTAVDVCTCAAAHTAAQLTELADALEQGTITARGVERRFGVPRAELYAYMRHRDAQRPSTHPIGPDDVHAVWVVGRGGTVPPEDDSAGSV